MEVKIDIRDLIAELIRKVWFIIILLILGALAAGAYKYHADSKVAKTTVSQAAPELSEDDSLAIDSYLTLQKDYTGKTEYVNNSLYMALDPYHYYRTDIQLFVDAEDHQEALDLMYAYQYYITRGGMVADINAVDPSVDEFYLQEMISMVELTAADSLQRDVMNVVLLGDSREFIDELTANVNQMVATYGESLQASIGEHELVVLDQSTKLKMDGAIEKYQNDTITTVNELKESLAQAEAALSSKQLAIAKQKLSGQDVQPQAEDQEVSADQPETTVTAPSVHISKKYVAVGAAGGFIIAILLITIFYVFSNTLKAGRDIQKTFKKSFLGEVSRKKKGILDRIASRLLLHQRTMEPAAQLKLLESKIASICRNQSVTSVAFAGADSLKEVKCMGELTAYLKEQGITADWIGDITKDPEAIGKMGDYQKIVLVEQLRKSRYEDVDSKIRFCEEQGTDILGYAVIA